MGYKESGVISINDLKLPNEEQLKKGVAIVECLENIPCNPCVEACPFGAITMRDLNDTPKVNYDKCTGCKRCIAICPGLAIFVVKLEGEDALISLPYEFLPVPKKGDVVIALDREGKVRGNAKVEEVRKVGKTHIITIRTKKEDAMVVRNIRVVK
ncbi:MAG: (4Fe-4S)-binding protein [Thermoplasmata archaeon]|nr:MAG: (4Fe-4S)-binding protein [Thermoplasmata archaeon]RLF38847.1 MAG: (4Fe-4S)-binding protein [Thermoplasmata archaeon]